MTTSQTCFHNYVFHSKMPLEVLFQGSVFCKHDINIVATVTAMMARRLPFLQASGPADPGGSGWRGSSLKAIGGEDR